MTNGVFKEGQAIGYTVDEALRNWLSSEEFEYLGVGYGWAGLDQSYPIEAICISKPKEGKRAHVEATKQEGARKWKTIYVVKEENGETVLFSDPVQKMALNKAKELCLSLKKNLYVVCEKVLIEGTSNVAVVTPGKSRPGLWRIRAKFRY